MKKRHQDATSQPDGRPLRILALTMDYEAAEGFANGLRTYAENIGRAMANRGHEHHILSWGWGARAQDYESEGVMVHTRPLPFSGVGRRLPKPFSVTSISATLATIRHYRRLGLKFDVLETPEFRAAGLGVALRGLLPVVCRMHTPLWVEAQYRSPVGPVIAAARSIDMAIAGSLERALVKRADGLTAASRRLAGHLADWSGGRDIAIVRNTTDFENWREVEGGETTAPVILAVGRLEPRKGFDVLLDAGARLRHRVPGLRIEIVGRELAEVGSRPYGEFLRRRARELGVDCELAEEVTLDGLRDRYRKARVLAVPSRQEGFSNVALEAMACGRPVVCTSNTGIAEIIEGSEAGAAVPAGDANRLADALYPYLASSDSAAESGRRARSVAEAQCGPERVAADTEAAYRQAIRRWQKRRSSTASLG